MLKLPLQTPPMCYEFDHACNGHLIEEITKSAGEETYFLVCKQRNNYFYSPHLDAIVSTMRVLAQEGINVKAIDDERMYSVLNSKQRLKNIFYGSVRLFNGFRMGYFR